MPIVSVYLFLPPLPDLPLLLFRKSRTGGPLSCSHYSCRCLLQESLRRKLELRASPELFTQKVNRVLLGPQLKSASHWWPSALDVKLINITKGEFNVEYTGCPQIMNKKLRNWFYSKNLWNTYTSFLKTKSNDVTGFQKYFFFNIF